MADGFTHAEGSKVGVMASAFIATYMMVGAGYGPEALWLIAGATLSHIITPDLDQEAVVTHDEARIYKISPLAGLLWEKFIFRNYAHAIPHRSQYSHSVPLGTLIRIAVFLRPYLYWLLLRDTSEWVQVAGLLLIAAYEMLPRLAWRGDKRKARTHLRVVYLCLPAIVAALSGEMAFVVGLPFVLLLIGWSAVDSIHIMFDEY